MYEQITIKLKMKCSCSVSGCLEFFAFRGVEDAAGRESCLFRHLQLYVYKISCFSEIVVSSPHDVASQETNMDDLCFVLIGV